MGRPLVSVIVPVFKVEQYLDSCVKSILNQTYSNLEIILVDDGSPDACGEMCDAYAKTDKRIKVIHKLNGGLSDARNAGLDIFTGDYVCFVDSDDMVSEFYVEHLLQLIDEKTELAVCVPKCFSNDNELEHLRHAKIQISRFVSSHALYELLRQNALQFEPSAWGKLYAARIFSSLRFPVGKYYEDLATTYLAIDMVSQVAHTTEKLYYYRQRKSSQSESRFNEHFLDILDIAEAMRSYILPKYPELEKVTNARVISAYSHILIRLPDNADWNSLKSQIFSRIVELRKGLLTSPIRGKNKMIILLSYLGERTFLFIVYRLAMFVIG